MAGFLEGLAKHGKRGVAYVLMGLVQTALGFYVACCHPEALNGFAAVLGAIDINLYGGGALAKWADARAQNGNGGGVTQ